MSMERGRRKASFWQNRPNFGKSSQEKTEQRGKIEQRTNILKVLLRLLRQNRKDLRVKQSVKTLLPA